ESHERSARVGGAFVQVADRLRPSVVTVRAATRNGLSSGTGVAVTRDGAILTNNHVVEGGREFEVELSSYDRYAARLVGADPATDLAVLKMTGFSGSLTPAVFGDSDELLVGEEVVAIGNALDFGWTVTHGIVSSLHRSNLTSGRRNDPLRYTDYIQTDAAINPGNSGGPLANLQGEVIGINVAILAQRADGIGFAIPANDARFVAEEILSKGSVTRGFLGLEGKDFRDLDNERRRRLGSGIVGGAEVTSVLPDSPAAIAGLRLADFVYAVDGKPVDDYQVLRNRIARISPGTTASIGVRRDGKDLVLKAVISRRPPEER
ncbi:MAG TPA: trypsin-like peptidase domain-containing protein, partial [Planctomycetota bacterium]|nr:trypsin-like peptidase domain-containing protein [Planctomycetota bacterium]